MRQKIAYLQQNKVKLHKLSKNVYWKQRYLLLLLVPAVVYFIIFHYIPMYGVIIAFKDYKFSKGIMGSAWVGLEHFRRLFGTESFWQVFRNTIVIGFWKFVWGFPAPILFALFLNELTQVRFKKTVQTISYLPHFISWVVLGGILMQLLSPSTGPVNVVLKLMGWDPIYFLADPRWFRIVLVVSHVWKSIGWGSIVYIAALTSVDQEIYEAASIDGATGVQKFFRITIPLLRRSIGTTYILSLSGTINLSFTLSNVMTGGGPNGASSVLLQYMYTQGMRNANFGYAMAIAMFTLMLAIVLAMISRKLSAEKE